MAQGKKQEPLNLDGIPAPSTNIQGAVIEGHSGKGKDVVRQHIALCALFNSYRKLGPQSSF